MYQRVNSSNNKCPDARSGPARQADRVEVRIEQEDMLSRASWSPSCQFAKCVSRLGADLLKLISGG